jgi:hypothetical protein
MTEGFRTKTSGGGIQIDQTYKNLALRAKGSFDPGTSSNKGKWRIGSITVTGNSPALAWRCAKPCAMVYATRSGTSITYTFMVADTSGTVEWWLFDTPDYGVANGPLGLRVRNPATNAVVFDSRMKYMRVVGAVNGSIANGMPANASYTGSPALVTGNSAYIYTSQVIGGIGSPPPYPWIDFTNYLMAALNGQQITWSSPQTDATDHPANQTFNNGARQDAYNFLVIDVANF